MDPAATRRAALEAERDFLLTSLDDLDAELAAGDLTPDDHRTLHDDYTRRAADVIRQLEGSATRSRRAVSAEGSRRLLWFGLATVFALGAGFLLARSTGERGVNDQITGSIDASARTQTRDCIGLAQGAAYLEAIECLDGVLPEDPQNAEAWSYSGWFVAITGFEAVDAGETAAAQELLGAASLRLDRSVDADPSFPDAYAFRSIIAARTGDAPGACDELETLLGLDPPTFVLDLVASVDAQASCGLLS